MFELQIGTSAVSQC